MEIRSIKRAAAVLRSIGDKPEGLSPTGIVEITGLSKATVHRILHTLASDDLVRVEGGRYLPGSLLLALAADSDPYRDLKRMATEELAALRTITGETAALVVRRGAQRVTILVALAFHELKVAPDIGSAKPVHAGAAGKALLAFINPDDLAQLLRGHRFTRLAANTVTSHAQFMRDVQRARQQGFATSSEESVDGQAAIAAPIIVDGNVVAVVNLSAPVVRANKRAMREWTPHVLATAKLIANAEKSRVKANRLPQVSRRSRL